MSELTTKNEPEKLTLETGKFYRTRDGRKAEVLKTDMPGTRKIVVVIYDGDENDTCWVRCYPITGVYSFEPRTEIESPMDLIAEWREPVKVEGWVNVYTDGTQHFHTSQETAEQASYDPLRVACVYVSGIEGGESC